MSLLTVNTATAATSTDDNVTATTGVQATFDVLANDTGVGALTLVAPNAWSLHGGSVSLVNNQLTYTSSAGYTGDDRIWYTFSDSQGNSNYGQVNITVTSSASWYKPTPLTTWQWQLQGTLNTSYNVEMYDIDLFDTDSSKIAELQGQGRKVICYFSGGTYEDWRSDESLFPLTVRGNSLADDGWLGERWLDIRSPTVKNIMVQRLQLAKNKGCDGVEPDNVDGYTNNPGFPLTYSDQIEYNKFLATEAHALGLSIGLKNDLDQIKDLVNDFDFAVNEECHFYEECEYSDQLNLFIDQGKAVFNAEYTFREGDNLATVCAKSNSLSFSTLVLPLSLDDSSRDSCLAN